MSKERELLKECRLMLDNPFNGSSGINLRDKITKLLAQPEQEPLSASAIVKLYTDSTGFEVHKSEWRNKILDFAEAIEKAHGIGESE